MIVWSWKLHMHNFICTQTLCINFRAVHAKWWREKLWTKLCPRTDGLTDSHGDSSIPPPLCCGGYKKVSLFLSFCFFKVAFKKPFPSFQLQMCSISTRFSLFCQETSQIMIKLFFLICFNQAKFEGSGLNISRQSNCYTCPY